MSIFLPPSETVQASLGLSKTQIVYRASSSSGLSPMNMLLTCEILNEKMQFLSPAEGQRPRNYLSCCCSLIFRLIYASSTPTTMLPPFFKIFLKYHFIYLSIYLSITISIYNYLSIYLSTYPFINISVYLSLFLYVNLSIDTLSPQTQELVSVLLRIVNF